MKKILFITMLLLAFTASAATKVKSQHFEIADSVRFFDKDNNDGIGYKLTKRVTANWPVAINGKKCQKLCNYLLDSIFYVNNHRGIFPNYPEKMNVMIESLRTLLQQELYDHNILEEYNVLSARAPGVVDIKCGDYPLNCWYENITIDYSHSVDDLAFFTSYYEDYFGGAHGMFFTEYLPFDINLNKPIHLKDIVTSPKKLLRILPSYDKRDKDVKWWQYIDTNDIDNFYIKNGKIVFSFAPYAIGPFCEGQIEVPVSLKTLNAKGLLTTYGKKYLK